MNREVLESGSCTQTDPEVFFPEPGQYDLTRMAKKICGNCVVLDLCLKETLANPPEYGIRAGLTASDRRKLRNGK